MQKSKKPIDKERNGNQWKMRPNKTVTICVKDYTEKVTPWNSLDAESTEVRPSNTTKGENI